MSVPVFNTLFDKWNEIPVQVPEVESESPIIVVVPTERNPMPYCGGGGSGKEIEESWFGSVARESKPQKAILKSCLQRR